MHRTHTPVRTVCLASLGTILLAAYTTSPPPPQPSPRVPTHTRVPMPNEGLVCALLGDAELQAELPTAGHGALGRARVRYGVADCEGQGDPRFALRVPRSRQAPPAEETPLLAER